MSSKQNWVALAAVRRNDVDRRQKPYFHSIKLTLFMLEDAQGPMKQLHGMFAQSIRLSLTKY